MENKNGFKEWLVGKGLGKRTAGSVCSRINRIQETYNIEAEYEKDACAELLEDLTYTQQDAKCGKVPGADISISGNYVEGFRSLKKALEYYVEYLRETYKPQKTKKRTAPCFYEGDRRGFHAYCGPKWRNVVQLLTRNPRRAIQQCECCGVKGTLDAAHIGGRSRTAIINDILDRHYKLGTDYYRVDLVEFEEKFKGEHTPWANAFFFLCKKCHNQYDGNDPKLSQDVENKVNKNRAANKNL